MNMIHPELFSVPEQDSPRRAWLKRYGVKTAQTKFKTGDEGEFGNDLFPWYAWIYGETYRNALDYNQAGGATEDDAISNLAKKKRWRLWNEEGFKQ
jgi:hypothetical protein